MIVFLFTSHYIAKKTKLNKTFWDQVGVSGFTFSKHVFLGVR